MTWSGWNEQREEDLRKLWYVGHSCSSIAGIFGCTRNTIVGKAARMKLPGDRTVVFFGKCSGVEAGTTRPKRTRIVQPKDEEIISELPKHRKEKPGTTVSKRTRAEYHAMLAQAVRNTVDSE